MNNSLALHVDSLRRRHRETLSRTLKLQLIENATGKKRGEELKSQLLTSTGLRIITINVLMCVNVCVTRIHLITLTDGEGCRTLTRKDTQGHTEKLEGRASQLD